MRDRDGGGDWERDGGESRGGGRARERREEEMDEGIELVS